MNNEEVREAFQQEGVINIRSSLMHLNFKTCFKRYSAYFFNLVSADSISKLDKLAIHDKNNHWHLPSIVNIKVDSLNVEEANQVSAELQVEQLVEGIREYYRVKKRLT
ncbi:hypothetical protein A7P61_01260 (plasmid) [Pantoea agglomerans pv. betae]|uniref:hypothetical protein n=1 Tax=Enterobacter agglomerans TaxID=549 RepID=UPI0012DAA844|nr:hypothetical protein [Pantoea agglomerans]WHU82132.1 hypothetical protein A7P61_01260 [Pantoea agglomerans pv. betae]